ncbi:MAG: DUF2703 domain-containing protein [Thermodesulfovibrionales bacterium]
MGLTQRKVEIDFLYLDLRACTRCKGTDASLDAAISEVSRILNIVGVTVIVRKTHVRTEKQARDMGLASSPTILINGKDIQDRTRESPCESCSDLIGGERCDCRIWTYRGKEYTSAPTALIVDAILREVYGRGKSACCPRRPLEVSDNIKRFFAAKEKIHF